MLDFIYRDVEKNLKLPEVTLFADEYVELDYIIAF